MKVDGKLIVTDETKEKALETIAERMKELGLDYKVTERKVEFTELTVELDVSKLKVIKHIFNLVKAPQEEIEYLCKAKSIVEATARDIINSVINSIRIKG